MAEHFDLCVIGSGPAGEKGAAQAAYFGKSFCLTERNPKPGGAAINTGTVPSKTLRETAWETIDANLERHKVTRVQGAAQFVDPYTVQVSRYQQAQRLIRADVFLLATGSRPSRPLDIPFDGRVVVDSDDVLMLTQIPQRLIVIGGGVIGCEYASIFGALGVRVTLIISRERLLMQLDTDLSDALRVELTRRMGVQVVLDANVSRVTVEGDLATVTLGDGRALPADCVLYCAGREGNSDGLQLENTGVKTNTRGFVQVDSTFRSTTAHIFAAGDVIGFPALASTAMEQARVAMCHAFDLKYKMQMGAILPYGVWTVPEIATVGMGEDEARAKGIAVEIGKASFRTNPRGQIIGETEGFVKLVFKADDKLLIGASVVGEGACELIHIPAAAIHFNAHLEYFIEAVFNYPTLSDAFKYAAYDGLQRLQRRVSRAMEAHARGTPPIGTPTQAGPRPT